MSIPSITLRAWIVALGSLFLAVPSIAMTMRTAGDQLILSAEVRGDELARVSGLLADHPEVRTVILRNSPGGDVPAGYALGELFRARGLRTAVSGYCYSSCSRMFLGGATRIFTDDFPPEKTEVGFHGHYDGNGQLLEEQVRRRGLKDWIIKHSDGKADVALVERWTTIPLNRGMIHFYLPSVAREWAAATFFCQGTERGSPSDGCERIGKSAIDVGVITSLDTISSNDKAELLAALQRPKPTGFASIDDLARIPLNDQRGIEEYRRFLKAPAPRAFAVSPDRANWAWNARNWDALALALSRCAERAGQTCYLYAVDEDVVWSP